MNIEITIPKQTGWSGVKDNVHDWLWFYKRSIFHIEDLARLTGNPLEEVKQAFKELIESGDVPSQYLN